MARSTGAGDTRAVRRDGPAGAGSGPSEKTRARGKGMTGQQSGSNRPAVKTGAAKRAPKKGEVPARGTRRKGTSQKTRPGKTGEVRAARSKKPSKIR
jgi:hypothetical protein